MRLKHKGKKLLLSQNLVDTNIFDEDIITMNVKDSNLEVPEGEEGEDTTPY